MIFTPPDTPREETHVPGFIVVHDANGAGFWVQPWHLYGDLEKATASEMLTTRRLAAATRTLDASVLALIGVKAGTPGYTRLREFYERDRAALIEMASISLTARDTALEERNTTLRAAVNAALQFLQSRDEMNAELHCAPVRWSPLTEKLRASLVPNLTPTVPAEEDD